MCFLKYRFFSCTACFATALRRVCSLHFFALLRKCSKALRNNAKGGALFLDKNSLRSYSSISMDSENKSSLFKNKKVLAGLISVLIIIPVAIGLISFVQQRSQNSPEVLAANEVNDILEKVGRLIEIPKETPTVATVSDVNKLSNQDFFKKAQNGDKVIIFPRAQKAILYRPSTDKIVEVAFYSPPDEVSPAPQTASATPTPTTPVSLRELIDNSPSGAPGPSVSPAAGAVNPINSPQPSFNP